MPIPNSLTIASPHPSTTTTIILHTLTSLWNSFFPALWSANTPISHKSRTPSFWSCLAHKAFVTLDWPKSSFEFICNSLWKDLNKLFGQTHTAEFMQYSCIVSFTLLSSFILQQPFFSEDVSTKDANLVEGNIAEKVLNLDIVPLVIIIVSAEDL